MTYSHLEKSGIQWPLGNGVRRRFHTVNYEEGIEKTNEQYPLLILPGGFHYHYGIGTTTKRAEGLAKVFHDSCIEIHPKDAGTAKLVDGDRVKVTSPRGEVETVCRVSGDLPEGVAYLAAPFFPVFVNNLLTHGVDTIGHRPEYKVFIGRVEKR
jgi:predicted molibdopterin-dependent oxidoreductase YjgC